MFKQPSPEMQQPKSPEQISVEQKQHESMCTARFLGEYITGTGKLSPEHEAFVTEYMKTHPGMWEKYDDDEVYLSKARLEGNKLHLDFCQVIEGQPFNLQEEVIELPV